MPLSDSDKKWISQQIEESHRGKGWGRVGVFVRTWSLPSVATALLLFALLQWSQYTQFRVHSEDRLDVLETGVKDIKVVLDTLRLKLNASNLGNPANIKDTKTILESAKKTGVKISQDIIREEGAKFVHAKETNPEIWQAVSAFLSYRSYLNVDLTPSLGQITPVPDVNAYTFTIVPKIGTPVGGGAVLHGGQVFTGGGIVSPDKAARLEKLANFGTGRSGPAFLFVEIREGDSLALDGSYIKNAIIRNTTVRYSGGPLVLDNVYFVNCTFELAPDTNARQLADVILASAAATFKKSA